MYIFTLEDGYYSFPINVITKWVYFSITVKINKQCLQGMFGCLRDCVIMLVKT